MFKHNGKLLFIHGILIHVGYYSEYLYLKSNSHNISVSYTENVRF